MSRHYARNLASGFDIAAVVASIGGNGHHPRFLIHDGLREADMAKVALPTVRWGMNRSALVASVLHTRPAMLASAPSTADAV